MAFTTKGCNNCGNDYMHNNDEFQFNEICQECYDNLCLVLHDLQSADEVSIVTEYDYMKHKMGNPIFFKGTRQECEEWRKNNTPISENIKNISSTISLEFKNNESLKNIKDNEYLTITSAYWRSDKIMTLLTFLKREALNNTHIDDGDIIPIPKLKIDIYKYKKQILKEINELIKTINKL